MKIINTYPHCGFFIAECNPATGDPDRIDDVLYNDMVGSINNYMQTGLLLCSWHRYFRDNYIHPVCGYAKSNKPSIQSVLSRTNQAFMVPDGYNKYWWQAEVILPAVSNNILPNFRASIGTQDTATTRTEYLRITDVWGNAIHPQHGITPGITAVLPIKQWLFLAGTGSLPGIMVNANLSSLNYIELEYTRRKKNFPIATLPILAPPTDKVFTNPRTGESTISWGCMSYQFGIYKDS